MSLDLNVYPESYPVFNKSRQYLVKNHISNLETSRPMHKIKITTSPGFNRHCELAHDVRISPPLADLTHNRALSNINNYQISHYPTSPLNPELEEQCMLLELFRNIDKIDFRKAKCKTPNKIVKFNKKTRFAGKITNFHNFQGLACKEFICPDCNNLKCLCEKTDSLCEGIKMKLLKTQVSEMPKLDRNFRSTKTKLLGKNEFNWNPKKKNRRRIVKSLLDFEGLKQDLLITPLH